MQEEVNRLKGEQNKPKGKGNTPKSPPTNHSSENERHQLRQRHKKSEKTEIRIDQEQVVEVDPSVLPQDAEFKEYKDVVVQDILLRTDNVRFYKKIIFPLEPKDLFG